MIFQGVVQCTINSHRAARIIRHGARHTAAGGFVHFVDSTHVEGFAPIGLGFLDEVPVAVVKELGGLPADRHRDQSVLGVEGLGVGQSALHALSHVAVGVIRVAFAG